MVQGSLAHKLRVLRAERGLTLREAASLTGVAKETISDLERSLRHPHDPTLAKIAKGYGVPVEELLAEELAAPLDEAPEVGPVESGAPIFATVHSAALRGLRQDSQAANRALESDQAQAYFKRHENDVKHFLLGHSLEEVAEEYYALMERLVQLEHKHSRLEWEHDRLRGANARLKEELARKDEEIARLREEAGVGP